MPTIEAMQREAFAELSECVDRVTHWRNTGDGSVGLDAIDALIDAVGDVLLRCAPADLLAELTPPQPLT